MELLRSCIRDIPNFPTPGIVFKDITPLLKNPQAFRLSIKELSERVTDHKANRIVAIESRGFIFGSALAFELNLGLIPVRKPKKLPFKTNRVEYALEYGRDSLEMHVDALEDGERILIVDDILATGGTALATAELVEKAGGVVAGMVFLSELINLKGREKLKNYSVVTLLSL